MSLLPQPDVQELARLWEWFSLGQRHLRLREEAIMKAYRDRKLARIRNRLAKSSV